MLSKGVEALDSNFLQKPFSLKSLAVKIREVLDEPAPAHADAAASASASASSSTTAR